jgi:2-keto-4-pentenoate hydratase/2-oxohepta-3-ene-1,7-dioic acid hydratase in catechol pathway
MQMKLVTYRSAGETRLGVLDGARVVDLQRAAEAAGKRLPSDMRSFIGLGEPALDDAEAALRSGAGEVSGEVGLAAPLQDLGKNVFCVGRNYKEHIIEGARARGREVRFPEVVELFSKPPTTVIGHEEEIRWDSRATQKLDYEVELALVVGRNGRDIAAARAYDYLYGYTIGNDVSARDAQAAHGQWFKGKSMDTFCPLGPCLVPKRYMPNPQNVRLTLRVNGETRQDSNTADMLFDIPTIVEQLSAALTLEVGDIILTGTPSGVALGMEPQVWLKDGDVVEAEIEGIGVLRNRVVEIKPNGR